MKKIILIDDNTNKVVEIFSKIGKMLWKGKEEEGIASKIIFFGDQFKTRKGDTELQDKNIKEVVRAVKQMLMLHSRDVEQWNTDGKMYEAKSVLIHDLAKKVDLSGCQELEGLIDKWEDKEYLQDKESLAKMDFTPLVSHILDEENPESQKDTYILLDVILLFDDIRKIEDHTPILSMGLYHALKEKGYKCYLYSSYAFDYMLIENYKKIYQSSYGQTIEVYHSNDFFSKNEASDKCLFYHLKE